MKPYYQDNQLTLWQGDCRAVLAEMEPDSVDCCVTSPPYYGLRDYKCDGQLGLEKTVEEYIATMVEVFRAVKRVLKPTGSLWLNIGDAYAGGNQGGTYTPGKWKAQPNAPAGWTNRQQRTNGLNTVVSGLKPKDLMLVPFRLALALQADGWWVRSDIIWAKPNPMPESVTDRPTKSHEYIFLLSKRGEYYFDQEAVREAHSREWWTESVGAEYMLPEDGRNDGGKRKGNGTPSGRNIRTVWTIPTEPMPMAHFATFPQALVRRCILAATSERGVCAKCGKPWERVVEKKPATMNIRVRDVKKGILQMKSGYDETASKDEIGNYGKEEMGEAHTTGWRPSCRCEAPTVPVTVLDPFLGSGTTALVARKLGRRAVGIELSEEYCKMAERRVLALPEPLP